MVLLFGVQGLSLALLDFMEYGKYKLPALSLIERVCVCVTKKEHHLKLSAKRGLPLPLGRGLARPNPKKGRSRDRKSFVHRVHGDRDHGLRAWSPSGARACRGRSQFAQTQMSAIQ